MAVFLPGRALTARSAFVLFWCAGISQALATPPTVPTPPTPIDEIVITANRRETPSASTSSTVTVLTAEDLRARQLFSLADVLREVPGLDVARTGGLGATTSIFMRGTNSNHTLLLVDGVEASDPSSFDGAVDFADLSSEGIDRVEILRGPASSLYGSDALGGVVNVITRRGEGPATFAAATEAGAHRTIRGTASASGSVGGTGYSLFVSRLASEGISQASALRGNTEADGYDRTHLSGRIGATLNPSLKSSFVVRYTRAELQLDDFGVAGPVDDPNHRQRNKELLLRAEGHLSLFEGRWRQSIGGSFSHHERRVDNLPDLASPVASEGRYFGRKAAVDWQHQLFLANGNDATLVLEAERDTARTRSVFGGVAGPAVTKLPWTSTNNVALVAQDQQRLWDFFVVSGSARVDRHSTFGVAVTYSVGAVATLFEGATRIRANHGTGFKAPTVLQLADPTYGEPSLLPERSRSVEVGAEHFFRSAGFSLGSTVFRNDLDFLVSFDPSTFKPVNVAAARIIGLESFLQQEWGPWRAKVDHTWMAPEDLTTGKELLRRARQKAGLGLSYRPRGGGTLSTRVGYVGERADLDFSQFPPAESRLRPYVLVSAAGSWPIAPAVTLFGRIENLLDARYEEVLGYGVPGISAYAGIRIEP